MLPAHVRRIVVLSFGLLAGCYALRPVSSTAPQPGQRIAVDITDAGRIALGGSMGPEILQIEGRLIQRTNDGYTIGVTSLHMLNGGTQVWTGEPVQLKNEFVRSMYERQLSTGRTVAAAVIGVAATAAIVATSLNGLATSTDPTKPGKDSGATQRNPGSLHLPVRIPLHGPRALPQIIRP